ncbi:hypothetical protein RCL1_004674 [Eukaryota sp. TZLM3-RCL]
MVRWVRQQRSDLLPVNLNPLIEATKENAPEITHLKFKTNWTSLFFRRDGFVKRRVTYEAKATAEVIVSRAIAFMEELRKTVKDFNIERDQIYNLDETALFMNEDTGFTYEEKGANTIAVSGETFEKFRLTAVLVCGADGNRKPPVLLVPGERNGISYLLDRKYIIMTTAAKSSWMNSELFVMLLDFLFPRFSNKRTLLISDSDPCHKSAAVNEYFRRRASNLTMIYIPG